MHSTPSPATSPLEPGSLPKKTDARKSPQSGQHDLTRCRIEAQLAGSIYSDDPDAIDQLEKRIASLEAERARIKAHNMSGNIKCNRDRLELLRRAEREES
jgi:hypothetical protein